MAEKKEAAVKVPPVKKPATKKMKSIDDVTKYRKDKFGC